ncbi:biotin/lipoyl-containing protein [Fictibacillus sp. Mic-4]|uniref:biotin/lipoyl-containing protein n=1 Tax=Fictibacillus TaxID=1329200 RepID=UPI00047AB20B|nr:biotin/lipoyl-containing protein [Fictibacillus gelatini]
MIQEIVTSRWDNREIVPCPSYGVVEEIIVQPGDRIYEWEPLFTIKKIQGSLEQITVGVSGIVDSLKVKKGDKVTPGTVLATIKDDLFVSGSD